MTSTSNPRLVRLALHSGAAGCLFVAAAQCFGTSRVVVPPGSDLEIREGDVYFVELVLNEGSTVGFHPELKSVKLKVDKLTLNGRATIDLTPRVPDAATPAPKTNAPPQSAYTLPGTDGSAGDAGRNMPSGISLSLRIMNVPTASATGSLWIRSDGKRGGNGGDGGPGGMGGGTVRHPLSCGDGGFGGSGGAGGLGGRGGDSASVAVRIGPEGNFVDLTANQAPGFAPSARPPDLPGKVAVWGAPGAGGTGGRGGKGGAGGGPPISCGFPRGDAKVGAPGPDGAPGNKGADGQFVPKGPAW